VSEQYSVIYHIRNDRTGERVCDDQTHVITMSDAELDEPGLIKEKLKIAGRLVGKALLKVLSKHVTNIKAPRVVQKG